MLPEFEYLYGKPEITGFIKQQAADFKVVEDLGFELTGEGEHVYIAIRKQGENTLYVARALAKAAGVPAKQVSYAGLKDRHAITEQWFGVHLPGKETPDFSVVETDQIQLLKIVRHNKKLRTGALKGNHFTLRLTDLSSIEGLKARLDRIAVAGVPNYFGEQRFGHEGRNIAHAQEMFAGKKVKDRAKRSFYLSAARSLLFNLIISERIRQGSWNAALTGDCLMLTGSNSFFAEDELSDDLVKRLSAGELQLTAPLYGKGELASKGEAKAFEEKVLAEHPQILDGLAAAGLRQERRALLLRPQGLTYAFDENNVTLNFYLPAGTFATSVIRELIEVKTVERTFDNNLNMGAV